jgi:hypothetical protein
MPGDADDVAITGAIIDLARNMGITSIAEAWTAWTSSGSCARAAATRRRATLLRAMPPDQLAGCSPPAQRDDHARYLGGRLRAA